MTIKLIVNKPEILQGIKETIDTQINYDLFYNGLDFTLNLDNYPDFDIFGCWNSNCEDRLKFSHLGSFQQKTLSNILKSVEGDISKKIRFFLGDNIYYDKELKDIRKKNEDVLNGLTINDDETDIDGVKFVKLAKNLIDNGFSCFTAVPSFMILGNHDVEYPYLLQYQISKCFIDVKIIDNQIEFGNWILPNAFYSVKINIHDISILFIIIDTNLLESDEYINFFTKEKKDEYIRRMIEWMENTLQDNINSIKIVMGHIPIFFYSHIKEKKEKDKKEKEEKKEKPPVQSRYNHTFLKIYDMMIQYNVTTYMCADEHNMQVLQDLQHGINHIICGASPGGSGSDEAYNLDEKNLYFSNKHIIVPELEIKFNKKIIINAPSFSHLIVHPTLLQFNLISSSNLVLHNKEEYCKDKKCINSIPEAQIYDIITIPKYRDLIAIYNCDEFNEKFC